MITEKDLQEAIAECEGQRNPTASTCIKLAAYLTILQNLYPESGKRDDYSFYQMSRSADPDPGIDYDSDTEFSRMVHGRSAAEIMPVMDELMSTIKVIHPRLYNGVINKL